MEIINKDSLYYLFLEIQRLHYNRSHVLLDEIGIYHGQPHMLFVLNKEEGLSQKELAERLNIKASTITVMLKRMEKSNLVIRKQDTKDKRISRVYITKEGREVCQKSIIVMKNIGEECFGTLTEEENLILKRLFMEIKDNLIVASEEKD